MGDRDLESLISNIGSNQDSVAKKQQELNRMKELMKKQQEQLQKQTAIIEELEGKVGNMYDLPADVEALKTMIGEQRGELSNKDTQLEISYGKVAELDAELKGVKLQIAPLQKNMDYYVTQVGELKATISEQNSMLKLKESTITEITQKIEAVEQKSDMMDGEYQKKIVEINNQGQDSYSQISQLKTDIVDKDSKLITLENDIKNKDLIISQDKQMISDLSNQISALKNEIQERDIGAVDIKTKIEGDLKEQFFVEKSELSNKVANLESALLDKDLAMKDAVNNAENATKQRNDMQAKISEIVAQKDALLLQINSFDEKMQESDAKQGELTSFYNENVNIAKNFDGLTGLFEHEPLFKCFNLVRGVGEINIDDIKNALGVPSITTNKYIQLFVDAGLFVLTEDGKIKLIYTLPKLNL